MKILFGVIFSIVAANAVISREGNERVVGGSYVKDGDYPFNAAIHYKNLFLCSGSFIGQNYIITTADCVYAYSTGPAVNDLTVKLGSVKSEHEIGVFEYTAYLVTVHPSYTIFRSRNDNRDFTLHYFNIAIISLTSDVVVLPTVSSITLPAVGSSPIPVGAALQLVGWGHQNGLVDDYLQVANLTTTNVQVCIAISGGNPTVNPTNMLCTDAYDPASLRPKGACTMDHGGPLIQQGAVQYLHGMVSWASCELLAGQPAKPTIYTNILAHRGWIFATSGI